MPDLMDVLKQLRTDTGLSLMDCRQAAQHALQSSPKGDMKTLLGLGVDFLRTKGKDKAMKKGARSTLEGALGSYVHHNSRIAVLVELNCETDFVARNENLQKFLKDVAVHIAANDPVSVTPEEIAVEVLEKEKVIYREQLKESGKPEKMWDKILEGKLKDFYKQRCLLQQALLTDPEGRTVQQHLEDIITKTGENIKIRRFVRWELGK